jgi:hypothetical protein
MKTEPWPMEQIFYDICNGEAVHGFPGDKDPQRKMVPATPAEVALVAASLKKRGKTDEDCIKDAVVLIAKSSACMAVINCELRRQLKYPGLVSMEEAQKMTGLTERVVIDWAIKLLPKISKSNWREASRENRRYLPVTLVRAIAKNSKAAQLAKRRKGGNHTWQQNLKIKLAS